MAKLIFKMFVYILSLLLIVFLIIYESSSSNLLSILPSSNEGRYIVSLITVKNDANAPFYYHTSLELIRSAEESFSYGFYPDHRHSSTSRIGRLFRPIYSMPGRIRSPDPLYKGSVDLMPSTQNTKITKPGKIVYRENYIVAEKQWYHLKQEIESMIGGPELQIQNLTNWSIGTTSEFPTSIPDPTPNNSYYSYYGSFMSDNCSSWVRKLLNKHLELNISCSKYRFRFLSLNFGIPLSPVDFPVLCSSSGYTVEQFQRSFGYTNTTLTR